MLNFIKSKLAETYSVDTEPVKQIENDGMVDDATFMEYANLFQELAEVPDEEETDDSERSLGIEIPIEDDFELDTIEINLVDGRITDVPMDATVMECQYEQMKPFEEFVQEAYSQIRQLTRESDNVYNSRVINHANELYKHYEEECIQEGLFGFGDININDDRVPDSIYLGLGKDGDKDYNPKVNVYFKTRNNKISKKQLDAVNVFKNADLKNTTDVVSEIAKRDYPELAKYDNTWDYAKPNGVFVPEQNGAKFEIDLCFDISLKEKDVKIWLTWSKPINSTGRGGKTDIDKCKKPSISSFKSKTQSIRESYNMINSKMPSRFDDSEYLQEAIDFGGAPEGGDVNPPAMGETPVDEPTVGVDPNATPGGGEIGDETTPPSEGVGAEAPAEGEAGAPTTTIPVENNDVSSQIADKVASDQSGDGVTNDFDLGDSAGLDSTDITFGDEQGGTGEETPVEDTVPDEGQTSGLDDIDSQIDDLGGSSDMGDESIEDGMNNDIDIENMTIDELIEQGSEKLKGMTIQQIKDFLTSSTPEQIQEAFILTSNNINKEVKKGIAEALSVLNDSDNNSSDLFKIFRKTSKTLNRTLSKASKSSKVYSEEEMKDIKKLNSILVDLSSSLKEKSTDVSYVQTIKSLIKSFVSQAVVVNKICDSKDKISNNQEAMKKHK